MSDLSSNSMSREELIRNARANCIRQIDVPGVQRQSGTHSIQEEETINLMHPATYIRLFIASLLFLIIFVWSHFHISVGKWGPDDVQQLLESEEQLNLMEEQTADLIEEKIIPVFHRLEE
ncbi:hypothetical protein [Anaeromicropila populeti]|uniref:Uncharacterized protein n=1 Tax=Anaeromicropila populeti TaxID=37658 RepID=A0A1I6L2G3_9FIRM|nr:hypothetical protein [Anaeromicropila populeti]SFR97703.1 hypothetical protein SAMN05661086_03024 [Anaeromicropila populeti]